MTSQHGSGFQICKMKIFLICNLIINVSKNIEVMNAREAYDKVFCSLTEP
jgi:hypothetical protein